MSKFDEILDKVTIETHENYGAGYSYNTVRRVATVYAEWYAKQCLEIAALNATLHIDEGTRISRPPSIIIS